MPIAIMPVSGLPLPPNIEASEPDKLAPRPVVSVVMLAYQHEACIAEAIEGVLAQVTEHSYELLIGEDCSRDRTREIALGYQRSHPDRIRVIYAEHNVGGLNNSQRLIRLGRGEFIAFCEGDDYWHDTGKLQRQVEAMREDPNVTLCHTDYDRRIGRWILRSVHQRRRPRHLARGDAYIPLLHGMTVKTATAMYRRDMLVRFLDTEYNRSDWPFGDYTKTLFAATTGKVRYLSISTATYRHLDGSAMNSGPAARLRMGRALAECRELYMQHFPVDAATARTVRRVGRERQMHDAFAVGDVVGYAEAHDWLRSNGFSPGRMAHLLRMAALRLRFPVVAIGWVKRLALRTILKLA